MKLLLSLLPDNSNLQICGPPGIFLDNFLLEDQDNRFVDRKRSMVEQMERTGQLSSPSSNYTALRQLF